MGIGFGEMVVIALVAIFVVGPDRLPAAARSAGRFVRQLRQLRQEFTTALNEEEKK